MNAYTYNPTTEDALDIHELIREERYARTLANIARRAESLWDDGYTAEQTTVTVHFQFYMVKTPKGDLYQVCLSDNPTDELFGDNCTCPAFKKYGDQQKET